MVVWDLKSLVVNGDPKTPAIQVKPLCPMILGIDVLFFDSRVSWPGLDLSEVQVYPKKLVHATQPGQVFPKKIHPVAQP